MQYSVIHEYFTRTELLLGADAMQRLRTAHICIVGVGGVGSYAAEAVARCGLGHITLVDSDTICPSNINRQIHATTHTIGQSKVSVMSDRIRSINPSVQVTAHNLYFDTETKDIIFNDSADYNFVIDAIDSVASKVELIVAAKERGIPIISSMGAGNKLLPQMLEIADIYKTTVCPLAKVMRKQLRACGVESLTVVYSKEPPHTEHAPAQSPIGSISFVPSSAGLMIAGEVVRQICAAY